MPRKKAAAEKPKLGLPNALEAAQEAARHAQEGNLKLARAVEVLRTGLETVVTAEFDYKIGAPIGQKELRQIATEALDAYSQLTGQSWRRVKLIGPREGHTGNRPVHESEMEA